MNSGVTKNSIFLLSSDGDIHKEKRQCKCGVSLCKCGVSVCVWCELWYECVWCESVCVFVGGSSFLCALNFLS